VANVNPNPKRQTPIESRRHQREMRELKRSMHRRNDLTYLGLFALLLFFGVLSVEIGRGFFFAQNVNQFLADIETRSPAEVKLKVGEYALRLHDRSPLIRKAAIAAMQVATGENIGSDPFTWSAWWQQNKDTWTYVPRPRNAPATPGVQTP
jgi:hypothetical protein